MVKILRDSRRVKNLDERIIGTRYLMNEAAIGIVPEVDESGDFFARNLFVDSARHLARLKEIRDRYFEQEKL